MGQYRLFDICEIDSSVLLIVPFFTEPVISHQKVPYYPKGES